MCDSILTIFFIISTDEKLRRSTGADSFRYINIGTYLRENFGANVIYIANKSVVEVLRTIRDNTRISEHIQIWFSGHGYSGGIYIDHYPLSFTTIYEFISNPGFSKLFFFLDCCRSINNESTNSSLVSKMRRDAEIGFFTPCERGYGTTAGKMGGHLTRSLEEAINAGHLEDLSTSEICKFAISATYMYKKYIAETVEKQEVIIGLEKELLVKCKEDLEEYREMLEKCLALSAPKEMITTCQEGLTEYEDKELKILESIEESRKYRQQTSVQKINSHLNFRAMEEAGEIGGRLFGVRAEAVFG